METLLYERTGHVGWLRLNRPQKLNSMTAGCGMRCACSVKNYGRILKYAH